MRNTAGQKPTARNIAKPRAQAAASQGKRGRRLKYEQKECFCVKRVVWDWDTPCALQWHAILGIQILLHWAQWCGCYNVSRRLRHNSQEELDDDIILTPSQLDRVFQHAAHRMGVSVHQVVSEIKIRKCVVFEDGFIDTWRREQYRIHPTWFTGINRWSAPMCECAKSKVPVRLTKNVKLPTWRADGGSLCRREDETDDWRDVYCHIKDVDYVASS